MGNQAEKAVLLGRIKQLLRYEPSTGKFYYREPVRGHNPGSEAGYTATLGYIIIRIDKVPLRAHRIVFLLEDDQWPAQDVDHIDRVRDNNIRTNLRKVSRSQNIHNRGICEQNQSGVTGVYWSNAQQKWRAYINVDGTRQWLYYGDSKEEAIKARQEAEQKHNLYTINKERSLLSTQKI